MKILTILFGYNTNQDSLTGVCQVLAIVVLETQICYQIFTDKERLSLALNSAIYLLANLLATLHL